LVTLIALSLSCDRKAEEYSSKGVITGQDMRMCACCGGWIINIEGENYLFDALPTNSSLSLEKESFPLSVLLNWELVMGGCPSNRIRVTGIKKST
jgi:hypothetical protein